MNTVRVYTVSGLSPDGEPVEMSIIADSAPQARQKAQTAGMRRAVVRSYQEAPAKRDPPKPDKDRQDRK